LTWTTRRQVQEQILICMVTAQSNQIYTRYVKMIGWL
jgi:hypothetical protein